jgi:hypothetical protein
MENACYQAPTTHLREESCMVCPPNSLILHAHAGSVPAIAGKLNLVSGTFAIWAAIFATLLRCTVASRVCALVLRFRLALFGGFFGDHCRTPITDWGGRPFAQFRPLEGWPLRCSPELPGWTSECPRNPHQRYSPNLLIPRTQNRTKK